MHINPEKMNTHSGISTETIKPFVRTDAEIDSGREKKLPETEKSIDPLDVKNPEIVLSPVTVDRKKMLGNHAMSKLNSEKTKQNIEEAKFKKISKVLEKEYKKPDGGIKILRPNSSGMVDYFQDYGPDMNIAIPGSVDGISILLTLEKSGEVIDKHSIFGKNEKDPVKIESELIEDLKKFKKKNIKVTSAHILIAKEENPEEENPEEEKENEKSYIAFRLVDAIKNNENNQNIPAHIVSLPKDEIEKNVMIGHIAEGGHDKSLVQVLNVDDM